MKVPQRYTKALLFVLTLTVAAYFWQHPYVATIFEICIAIGLLSLSGWRYWKYYLSCAVLGAISEILVIHGGAWSYALPQLLGIPLWVPFAWGNASLFYISLAPHVTAKLRKSNVA